MVLFTFLSPANSLGKEQKYNCLVDNIFSPRHGLGEKEGILTILRHDQKIRHFLRALAINKGELIFE
ncbi:MAG: hypothetical protein LBR79_04960 [Oscillospiraceae bacterium]|nr:hypothetical protein [Oscillospiraceae bacterium]